jgi:hypothetical protein
LNASRIGVRESLGTDSLGFDRKSGFCARMQRHPVKKSWPVNIASFVRLWHALRAANSPRVTDVRALDRRVMMHKKPLSHAYFCVVAKNASRRRRIHAHEASAR